jgi:hypothetical protein
MNKPYRPPSPYTTQALQTSDTQRCATSSHVCCAHVFSCCGASTAGHWEWAPWYPYQGLPEALPLPLRGCRNLVPLWDRATLLPARLRAHLRQHNWFPQAPLPGKQLDSGDFYRCQQQLCLSFRCWVQHHHGLRCGHIHDHQVLEGPY